MVQHEDGQDPVAIAEAIGLTYVDDGEPGIQRIRRGSGFGFRTPDGSWLTDEDDKTRFEDLAIPPAWTDVWICPDPDGHVQATGRDDAGRKQYLYHERWREARDAMKFDQLTRFPPDLVRIRDEVDAGLRQRSSHRLRVLALVVALLDETLIRVGNAAYARDNESFGLTTLRTQHVDCSATVISFEFVGKGGTQHQLALSNRRLARAVAACAEVPGQDLFTYRDEERQVSQTVTSADVNEWIRDVTDGPWTAKHFRLWGGTVAAAEALAGLDVGDDPEGQVLVGYDAAAERLGNTRDVARASYVHPAIPEAFRTGLLGDWFARARARRQLTRQESAVAHILDDAG